MSLLLSKKEKLDLQRILDQSDDDVQNNTDMIMKLKHSSMIRNDIHQFGFLKEKFFTENLSTMSEEETKSHFHMFEQMVELNCNFLFTVYPEIYKKMIKDELDLTIMMKLLQVLKLIEEGEVDQHEASVVFGKMLKELFIDSVIKHGKHLDETSVETSRVEGISMTWKEYKHQLPSNSNEYY